VLLIGEGAEAVAKAAGLALVPESYFHTPDRLAALRRIQDATGRPGVDTVTEQDRHGTVGAVALDAYGHVASATSTGGRTNKLPGRVGDSPVVGAGTYADDRTAAISCTGAGEYFQRLVLAHRLAMRMELTGETLRVAARATIDDLTAFGGGGGFIAIDATGAAATPFNGAGMHRGLVRCGESPVVAIFADDAFPADLVHAPLFA
jgi:beta-aspartyl-peptidase (threonine type)